MSNIHEVARQAGVSAATVSRTFSAPNLLNEHTQKRVLEVARRLNYQPRSLRVAGTRGASRSRSVSINAIGFQFFAAAPTDTLQTNTFYAPMLAGALAEASDLGLHLLLHTTDRHSLAQEAPRMIVEQTVDGMLLVGTAEPAILARFAQHVPHIVLLDNHDETGEYESVISDGFGGAFRATHYLLELGHRRICFLSEPGVATFQDRLRGYRCALLEAGIGLDPNLVVMGNSPEEIARLVTQRLSHTDAPTALLSANDYSAYCTMRACREMGLQVPRDLSVIGFDDIPFSAHTDVPLTTVRVNKEFMGRLAVCRLQTRMKAGLEASRSQPPVGNLVPVALIIRDSCRRL